MESLETDKEVLEQELDQIKEAFGIQDRYPGGARTRLVFGVLVGLTSVYSQVIYLKRLLENTHGVLRTVLTNTTGMYTTLTESAI